MIGTLPRLHIPTYYLFSSLRRKVCIMIQRTPLPLRCSFIDMCDRGGKAIGLIASVQVYIGFHFVPVLHQMMGAFEYLLSQSRVKMMDLARAMRFLLLNPVFFIYQMPLEATEERILLLGPHHQGKKAM